ncbi:exotoxin beta-grasp domain-containing protein [Staphylococcus argenteus]|uniref:Enterotoxin-like toxin X n=1 Tax=Staphylococcus argenteus TaxID=985002 RepID=A0A6M6A6G6_9STAP|nr:toxin [Staphylococcus argenteus]API78425.1 toxin [Staphylococcus argenteus]AXH79919.1 staphylococcal enterotoxin-like X gene [Staphylococcus argenteus]MBE2124806.1 toxin [Staphylococcus argenteus]MBE2142479.1 toxin [Staphylococcus argenteus]MCG6477839.1 toxin [Staphylococcus argenteus]
MFKKHHSKNSIVLKSILSLGIIYSGIFGINSKADASIQDSSSVHDKQLLKVEEVPNNSEKALVKKLYDRYSKDTINGKSNKSRNWVYSERPLNENQVRIHLEGTYTVAGRVYTPKRNITLNKEVVTLKELDHIVRFAHISYGLYMGEHLPKGNIVINTKDGGKYTLESHKELQKDRENVKINTDDIKNVTFELVKSVNDIEPA